MRNIILCASILLLAACNNSKEEKKEITEQPTGDTANTTTNVTNTAPAAGSPSVAYVVEDQQKTASGSILVQRDKDKLSPGNDFLGMITGSGNNKESITVNFLFDLKPGVYPVVGLAYTRDAANGKGQVFGGLLGGKPKLTDYKVNLTSCENLGSNNVGGNRWRISGEVTGDVTIDAMSLMKMDKEHPDNIKISKFSFSNLTFDDNWEQMMQKTMEALKK